MARRTFPKGGAGRNPEQGKNPARDERRVSCSAVARKGSGGVRSQPEDRFCRSKGLRRSAGSGSESSQGRRVRRYGRLARVGGRSALVVSRRKPTCGDTLPAGMQKCKPAGDTRCT